MIIRRSLIFACTLMACSLGGCNSKFSATSERADLPLRSQCITRVILDNLPDNSSRLFTGFAAIAYKNKIPLAGYSFQENRYIYFQYKTSCSMRLKFSNELMRIYTNSGYKVNYNISAEPVTPSTKTIDLQGDGWAD